MIQILFTPRTSFNRQQMKVQVNDKRRQLNQNNQVVVEESNKPVAVVQCDQKRCEILSEKYGVYVSIDRQRVAVEVSRWLTISLCNHYNHTNYNHKLSHFEIRQLEFKILTSFYLELLNIISNPKCV